jgi:hypothetical protein
MNRIKLPPEIKYCDVCKKDTQHIYGIVPNQSVCGTCHRKEMKELYPKEFIINGKTKGKTSRFCLGCMCERAFVFNEAINHSRCEVCGGKDSLNLKNKFMISITLAAYEKGRKRGTG